VRILVLPGHFECCHAPVLSHLDSLKREDLFVSVRGQYCPDWMITSDDGVLNRRPTLEEIERVQSLAERYGLQNVLDIA